MKTKVVQVLREQGMDAMNVALCVQRASQFGASVYLTDGTKRMNAKSLMGMMTMGLMAGDSVTVEADGADEEAALSGLCEFFEGK